MRQSGVSILWSNPGNPPDSVARGSAWSHATSAAPHKIKAASDLSGADLVIKYSDGSVTDQQGEPLGNLHDED